MNHKDRVNALEIIKMMDKDLFNFIAFDTIDNPNNKDLHVIVQHRWPYLMKYVKPLYKEMESIASYFVKELEVRKNQYDDGLISHREYISAIYHEAHLAFEEIKDFHE